MNKRQTNRLLGYPDDARLLLINADDFGMCHAVNDAIVRTLKVGVVRSTTLMVPCPWALNAMHYLAGHPETPFGVHLTVISEWPNYRWRPLTPTKKVPSLVTPAGYFYNFQQMPGFLAQVQLDQLETEFRAQIETVINAGLSPSHLDWHALRIGDRQDVMDLMFRLAKEYGLALRVFSRAFIEKLQNLGFPTNDYDFMDSYLLDPVQKSAHYAELLHDLPAGLSEWAVHPAFDTSELLAIELTADHIRQTDFDFMVSPAAKEIITAEGIILMDYRALQAVWRGI